MFQGNVGNIDKALRLAVGLGILFVGYYYQSYLGFLGIIPMATAALGYCPAYTIFGVSTCQRKHGKTGYKGL